MPPTASLSRADAGARADGLVLMLHGGSTSGFKPVDDRNLSWRRSRWMMGQVASRLNRGGASVWLLRHGVRGWNAGSGAEPSPVPEARWALHQVRRELGDLPVVLLGHSMGARTAVAVADHPNVVGVVALAPWLPADEPTGTLAGRALAAAHGRSDPITSYRETAAFCREAEGVATSVELRDMGRVGHYLLRRIPVWNDFAVIHSLDQLGVARAG